MAFESSLTTGLGGLDIWKYQSTDETPQYFDTAQHVDINLAANYQSWLFVLNDAQGIDAVNLSPVDKSTPIYKQEIHVTPRLNFKKYSIQINKTGQLLAVVGAHVIAICKLPHLDVLNPSDPIHCKSKFITKHLPLLGDTEILKVRWHPLSASHLVVLTSENILRIFDIENLKDGPEQVFNLNMMLPKSQDPNQSTIENTSIVNFCFGDTNTASWQAFSIYFLTPNSQIFALSPVIPFNCYIPSHFINTLKSIVALDLKQIKKDSAEEGRNFGGISPNSSLDSKRKALGMQQLWLNLVSGTQLAESGFEVFLNSPNGTKYFFDVQLQGPLLTFSAPSASQQFNVIKSISTPVADLFAISGAPAVLVRTHASGHLELLLLIEHLLLPSWRTHRYHIKPAVPKLMFWSGIDLSTQSGANSLMKKKMEHENTLLPTPPQLLTGLHHGNMDATSFYVYSSCGIVCVNVPWIKHANDVLSRNSTRRAELPPTTLNVVWNCINIDQPLSKIIGIAPFVRPLAVQQLNDAIIILTHFPAGQVKLIPTFIPRDSKFKPLLNTPSSILSTIPSKLKKTQKKHKRDTTSSSGSDSDEYPSSDEKGDTSDELNDYDDQEWDIMERLASLKVPSRLGLFVFPGDSPTEILDSKYSLEFYIQISNQFNECTEELEAIADDIETRIDFLGHATKKQLATHSQIHKNLVQASERQEELMAKLSKSQKIHEVFAERVEVVKKTLRIIGQISSPAEEKWLQEMKSIKKILNTYQEKTNAIELHMKELQSELKQMSVAELPEIAAPLQAVLRDSLAGHNSDITDMVSTLENMKIQLTKFPK